MKTITLDHAIVKTKQPAGGCSDFTNHLTHLAIDMDFDAKE